MVAQAPFAYLIGRFPAGKVLGISCVFWGEFEVRIPLLLDPRLLLTFRDYSLLSKGMSVLTMVANKNYTHVLVNRFFLGV